MEKRLTTVAAAVSILATSLYLILTIQNEEILCFPYLEIVSKIQHNATLALLKKPSKKVIEEVDLKLQALNERVKNTPAIVLDRKYAICK